jgi:hypothetical protein
MSVWDSVRETRTMKIKSLSGFIPGYCYSTEGLAQRTDETFCSLMVENLRACKRLMFNILETAFELHRELLLREFEGLRDGIDVFSDEIKARAFRWDRNKGQRWLEKLVDYDYRILTSLGNLYRGIEGLQREFLASGRGIREARSLDEHTGLLKKGLDEIVILFKERDAICNIGESSLEDAFDEISSELRKGFAP